MLKDHYVYLIGLTSGLFVNSIPGLQYKGGGHWSVGKIGSSFVGVYTNKATVALIIFWNVLYVCSTAVLNG